VIALGVSVGPDGDLTLMDVVGVRSAALRVRAYHVATTNHNEFSNKRWVVVATILESRQVVIIAASVVTTSGCSRSERSLFSESCWHQYQPRWQMYQFLQL
jgi:hypothetical protein